jgi:hypothetical protein
MDNFHSWLEFNNYTIPLQFDNGAATIIHRELNLNANQFRVEIDNVQSTVSIDNVTLPPHTADVQYTIERLPDEYVRVLDDQQQLITEFPLAELIAQKRKVINNVNATRVIFVWTQT